MSDWQEPVMHWPTHIMQEDRHGCGAACYAMITGRTYRDAARIFGKDFQTEGISIHDIDQCLAEDGYAVARKYTHVRGVDRDEWPVKPFAPIHLVQVSSPLGAHFVVMLANGMVLDPVSSVPHDSLQDYEKVWNITGIVALPGSPADAEKAHERVS